MEDWKEKLASLAGGLPMDHDEEPLNGRPAEEEKPVRKDTLHVVTDRKGRKGKTATIIEGFTIPDEEVERLASEMKQKIGVGGSARGGEILLQGECRDKAAAFLKAAGFKVK